MQINYCYSDVRRSTAPGFMYAPSIENTIQDMMVPPIYAPYGTYGYWPIRTARNGNSVLSKPDTSIAPNSAQGNSVAAAAIASSFGVGDAPPAASPASAQATGQAMGPVTLVAPMPSITPSPNAVAATPAPVCNSVDSWVSQNPMIAALGVLGVFFLMGGRR